MQNNWPGQKCTAKDLVGKWRNMAILEFISHYEPHLTSILGHTDWEILCFSIFQHHLLIMHNKCYTFVSKCQLIVTISQNI